MNNQMLADNTRGLSKATAFCLAWLAASSLVVSGVLGNQPTTLCFSADGHVDIKVAGGSCGGCPVSVCHNNGSAGAPVVSPGEQCCYDIPVSVVPIVYSVPKPMETHDSAVKAQPIPAVMRMAAAPLPVRTGHRLQDGARPHHLRQPIACLRTVQLLV